MELSVLDKRELADGLYRSYCALKALSGMDGLTMTDRTAVNHMVLALIRMQHKYERGLVKNLKEPEI